MNCKSRILALIAGIALPAGAVQAQWVTPTSQMEKLDRAPVALPSSSGRGIFLSWRFLGTDHLNTKFDVIRKFSTEETHRNILPASGASAEE